MGRHGNWDEHEHPRDVDGTFTHTSGGSGGRPDTSNKRGMPDSVTTADIPVRNGKEVALDFHPDGSATFTAGTTSVRMPKSSLDQLSRGLNGLDLEDTEPGRNVTVKNIEGRDGAAYTTLAGLLQKQNDGSVSLRLAPNDDPSYDELENAPEVRLTSKDIDKISDAILRGESSTRMDTGYGDADFHITDDNKFAFRHLGDDGKPVDVKLNPKSFAKIVNAVDVVIDGWDENDDSLADDEVVTKRTVSTNAGRVSVELLGEWGGTSPDDRLRILAEDGSWGLIIAGPHQSAFADALSNLENAGESLEIYDASMKWKK